MNRDNSSLLFETRGYFGKTVQLRRGFAEGYPTGEYAITGMTKEQLQELADWMISLPPELYHHVEGFSRYLERFLLEDDRR